MKIHEYNLIINWTENKGEGTRSYRNYDLIQGYSNPSFRGDASKYNPEDLFCPP